MLKKTAFLPGETYIQKLELPAIGQISKVSIIKDDGDGKVIKKRWPFHVLKY
jgi:hypothetical protein